MRVIFKNNPNNGLSPKDCAFGNKDYIISPEIDHFLIPKKGRKCRTIRFRDDGIWNLDWYLENDNIKIQPEDIVNQKNFWQNKGLFVKIIYKEPFEFDAPLYTAYHYILDLYRNNNGYARLIDDELINIAIDRDEMEEEDVASKELLKELDLQMYTDEEFERIFEYAEFMYYPPR